MNRDRTPPSRDPPSRPDARGERRVLQAAQDIDRAISLDDRIVAVEARLMAREGALAEHLSFALARLRDWARPRRLIVPLVGIGVAAIALGWLLRGRTVATAAHAAAVPRSGVHELPWMPLLGLAWPLLPLRWRARISPTTAATVISVGAPLLQRLFATREHPPLETTDQVDLARYAGRWYEIARLPESFEAPCDGQPTAHYAFAGDGLRVVHRCRSRDGHERVARGVAHPVPGSGNAKLRISMWPRWLRWLPLAWAPYWVLYVDEGYDLALVGHPNRRHLWVLSRRPRMAPAQLGALVRLAGERGFPVEQLRAAPAA